MMLNTCGAVWRCEGEFEETESQDCTVGTDICVWGACESAASLTLSVKWDKVDDDDERLSDAEFAAEEEELEHYAGLVQE